MPPLLTLLLLSLAFAAVCGFGMFKLWGRGAMAKTGAVILILPLLVSLDMARVAVKHLF